jgi:vacuolar-type H+-ATPase subunit H
MIVQRSGATTSPDGAMDRPQTRTADLRREDLSTMIGKKKTLREQLLDQASDLAGNARDKAGPVLTDARDRAVPVLANARDRAVPVLADARDKAAPYVSDARDKAAPYVSDARDKFTEAVLPVLTAALASVDEATEEVRGEATKRGKAVGAALKGELEVPEDKPRRGKLLMLLGLGGLAYAAYKKFGARQPTTNWQSSYTPPPAPTPAPAGGPVAGAAGAHRAEGTDDTAASDPTEAASDAADVPHQATTPDNPVEDIDVSKN